MPYPVSTNARGLRMTIRSSLCAHICPHGAALPPLPTAMAAAAHPPRIPSRFDSCYGKALGCPGTLEDRRPCGSIIPGECRMMRVGIVGLGTIGRALCQAIDRGDVGVDLVAVT